MAVERGSPLSHQGAAGRPPSRTGRPEARARTPARREGEGLRPHARDPPLRRAGLPHAPRRLVPCRSSGIPPPARRRFEPRPVDEHQRSCSCLGRPAEAGDVDDAGFHRLRPVPRPAVELHQDWRPDVLGVPPLLGLGRRREAESLEAATIPSMRRVLGDLHPGTCLSLLVLGGLYVDDGRYAEAEPLLLSAYEGYARTFSPDNADVQEAATWLVKLYEAWGRPEKAREWRAKLTTEHLARRHAANAAAGQSRK